jgi:hypothetical protein
LDDVLLVEGGGKKAGNVVLLGPALEDGHKVGGLAAQALVTLQDKLLDGRSVVRRGVPPASKRGIESRDKNKIFFI